MRKITIEVPDEFARDLQQYSDKLGELLILGLRQMKVQEALTFYTQGIISFERAAELTGLPREELVRQARASGIQPRWSKEMVQAELG